MGDSKRVFLDANGQSVVEYILLLVVITSLVFAVFRSQVFKDFLGEDSSFFKSMKTQIEYSYRHGLLEKRADESDYGGDHHSYINPQTGNTRFFGGKEQYGD